jgi:hypothetical protein
MPAKFLQLDNIMFSLDTEEHLAVRQYRYSSLLIEINGEFLRRGKELLVLLII